MINEKQTALNRRTARAIVLLRGLACGALLLAWFGGGIAQAQAPPAGEWTWISGSSSLGSGQGQSGMYPASPGIAGTGYVPGGRQSAASWTDSSGNLWLFGGFGYGSNANFGYLNDVWVFRPSLGTSGEWEWVGGSSTLSSDYGSAPATYGTEYTAAAGNTPGGRESAASWTGTNGNFWLFGGLGVGGNELNDLWRFTPSVVTTNPGADEWAWMGGSPTANPSGVYTASPGTPAVPGGRQNASTWTDSSGNFWLFGGQGYDANGNYGDLNDLWEFNPSAGTNGEWTWMGGSSTVPAYSGQPGMYGTMGTPAAANIPGGRYEAASWTDSSGNFWLFGGYGYDAIGNSAGYLNDLWEFNPTLGANGEWTWMGGSSVLSVSTGLLGVAWPGVYGTETTPAVENTPGGRDQAGIWTGSSGNFWLFGGQGDGAATVGYLNDLWEFNSPTSQWVWQSGSGTPFLSGSYGTQPPPVTGTPGSRVDPISWIDLSGNLWLFGGNGYDVNGNVGELNDLWEYPPAVTSFAGPPAAPAPVFSEASGTYSTTQMVSISEPTATSGATIYYTTDGTTPSTVTSSIFNSGTPIAVSSTEPLEAIATAPGDSTSAVAYAVYTITPQVATPAFYPAAGPITSGSTVTINDATLSAAIFYTTNGDMPTLTGTGLAPVPGPNTSRYNGPITVSSTETIEAIAYLYGDTTSAVATALYTVGQSPAAMPSFSLSSGTYGSAQSVMITDSTPNATIYYTTNGTMPTTTTSSTVFSGSSPITISIPSTETIEAIATASGYTTSNVNIATYTIMTATPTFLPVAGAYNSVQTVYISDTTPYSFIYYTIGASTPTTSSTPYNSSTGITVSSTETINAIAIGTGYAASAVASALYTITLPAAATPTFSLAAGTYTSVQPVTISSTTPNATIYYTTDNSPATTSSPLSCSSPCGPITVSSTETINAIATASGFSPSADASALYTINLTAMDNETITTTDTPSFSVYNTIVITPAVAVFNAGSAATAMAGQPYSGFTFTATGGIGTLTLSETGLLPTGITFVNGTLSGAPSAPAASAVGSYPFSITATDSDGHQGTQTGYTLVITAPTSTPTFSPAAGAYLSAQTVTITDIGATIYYTTNGTMPTTTTSSTVFSGSSPITINVSSSETINAIAVASPFTTSALASAAYVIGQNPVPVITSLSPAIANAGGAGFTMTVNGSNFAANSTVYWQAAPLSTMYVSATQLMAQVTAPEIGTQQADNVTVHTPAPGGGTSNEFAFEVDSPSGTTMGPVITATTETVAAGSPANYPVTLPSAATSVTVTCLNAPVGTTCSFNSATNQVTITTPPTTPAGTYTITVVFTLTESGAASGFILLPILLLPLLFLRRELAARDGWITTCLGLVLLAGAIFAFVSCGASGPGATHTVTSSGSVTLTVT